MFITHDENGFITGCSNYKFMEGAFEIPDEDIANKKYDIKAKKLIEYIPETQGVTE